MTEFPEHRASRQPDAAADLVEMAARALFEHDRIDGEQGWADITELDRQSYRDAQRGIVAAVEARVRAELAEEIAQALDASVELDRFGFSREIKLADAIRIAREHGSRP